MKKKIGLSICIMMLFMILLSGCKPKFEGEEYEAVYTCEVVEDISQEENISFSEVIMMDFICRDWIINQEEVGVIYYYFLLFKDGRVYCVNEKYRDEVVDRTFGNCDDAGWVNLNEVYYLGRLSGEDLREINSLIESVDLSSEPMQYYMETEWDYNDIMDSSISDNNDWNSTAVYILYDEEDEGTGLFKVEGWYQENERRQLLFQTTDEKALELMHFIEESPFYTTWLELIFEEAE